MTPHDPSHDDLCLSGYDVCADCRDAGEDVFDEVAVEDHLDRAWAAALLILGVAVMAAVGVFVMRGWSA